MDGDPQTRMDTGMGGTGLEPMLTACKAVDDDPALDPPEPTPTRITPLCGGKLHGAEAEQTTEARSAPGRPVETRPKPDQRICAAEACEQQLAATRDPRTLYCDHACRRRERERRRIARRRAARIAERTKHPRPCANPRCRKIVPPELIASARHCEDACQRRHRNNRAYDRIRVKTTDAAIAAKTRDESGEVWAPIPGLERYAASTLGRIKSYAPTGRGAEGRLLEPKLLKLTPNYAGYLVVNLAVEKGRYRQLKVHRLVLMAFVGPPPTPHHHGSHMNGEKADCRLLNVCWETREQNNSRKGL